jgi:hypothetical protein
VAISGIMTGLVTIVANNLFHVLSGWPIGISPLLPIMPGFVAMGVGNFIRTGVYIEVEGIDLVF